MKKLPEEERKQRLNNYKNEYQKANYTQVHFSLRKDLVARFKEKCAEDGIQYAKFLKDVIDNFLDE